MSENHIEKTKIKEYIQHYLHFGHLTSQWNPKMAPYIFAEVNGYHLINLIKTKKLLDIARLVLEQIVGRGGTVLLVGTTKEVSGLIKDYAEKCNFFYTNYRWLGGMFTNWVTLQKRITRLKELENLTNSNVLQNFSKNDKKIFNTELNSLKRLFDGIKNMKTLPDLVIFTNQKKDLVAVEECLKLGIPTICLIDTDSNPDIISYPIPTNDESAISINFILNYLTQNIIKNF